MSCTTEVNPGAETDFAGREERVEEYPDGIKIINEDAERVVPEGGVVKPGRSQEEIEADKFPLDRIGDMFNR